MAIKEVRLLNWELSVDLELEPTPVPTPTHKPTTATNLPYKREILKVHSGAKYPYQVGNSKLQLVSIKQMP